MKSALTLLKRLLPSVTAMSGLCLRLFTSVALAAAGLVVAAPGHAQDAVAAPCRLCGADASGTLDAAPVAPLRLQVETRLDFDKIVFDGAGSASLALSPDGAARLSGAATAAGARAMPGSVLIRGEPGRAVRVDLPGKVTLFGDGHGTISLDFADHRPARFPANSAPTGRCRSDSEAIFASTATATAPSAERSISWSIISE